MNKIDKNSKNIIEDKIEFIKKAFPEVFVDGKIDFEMLKVLLGENIELSNEKYQFSWNGKNNSIKFAQTPSTATLIPFKNESENWDTTQNLYIEGDNAEALKLLQKTFYGKIKMIYIDPPYNTGHDFVYNDDFKDDLSNYKSVTSQACRANPNTDGRFHTNWLNMMYSRLILAKNLLKDDGVIFISIDDNEIDNLSKICSEIFGESNFICKFIWKSKLGKVGTTSLISSTHEYILCYAKNYSNISFKMIKNESEGRKENLRQWGIGDRREDRPSMWYPITINGITVYPIKEDGTEGRWRVGKETAEELLNAGCLELSEKNGMYNIYRYFPSGVSYSSYDTLLLDEIGTTARGALALKNLGLSKIFDFSKPVELIKHFAFLCSSNDDIILDFFAGSSTTAEAIMKLNSEDKQNRRFIMIQLPELCEEASEAYKNGFKNICEIGKERIRRAGQKIYNELKEKYDNAGLLADDCINPDDLDFGFKVFKLETTNIKPWDGSYKIDEQTIFDYTDTIKDDRTNLDVAYEIMLKYGIFNMPLKEVRINNKTMYNIGDGFMIICLDDKLTMEDITEIAKQKPHCVVFKEKGFEDDNIKMNATYTLERVGVEDVKCI